LLITAPGGEATRYEGASAIDAGMTTFERACPTSNYKSKKASSFQIQFPDGNRIVLRDFVEPEWGLSVGLVIEQEYMDEENDTGLCMNKYVSPGCADTMFEYYIDDQTCADYECAKTPGGCNPEPPIPCQGEPDLKAEAEAFCADCQGTATFDDCVFDVCLGGHVSAGQAALDTCDSDFLPEVTTPSPPTCAPLGKKPCLAASAECAWDNKAKTCSDKVVVEGCAPLGKKPCLAQSAECAWDNKAKTCSDKVVEEGCAPLGKKPCLAASDECSWDNKAKTCSEKVVEEGCALLKKKPCLAASDECSWDNKARSCSEKVVEEGCDHLGKKPCLAASDECSWDNKAKTCSEKSDDPCTGKPKGVCKRTAGCAFAAGKCSADGGGEEPDTGCDGLPKGLCKRKADQCEFSGGNCFAKGQAVAPSCTTKNKSQCRKASECVLQGGNCIDKTS